MGQLLLFIVVALVVAAIVFGVTVMMSGGDSGLTPVEPDGKSLPLPGDRPLGEEDIFRTRFDTAFRGYRMAQVDQALQRAAYDIGYKGELIGVLEAEVAALREGRTADADVLRRAREAAIAPPPSAATTSVDDGPVVLPEVPPPADKPASAQPAASGPGAEEPAAPKAGDGEPAESR
jgi:DivIVA domain-containing protein